MKGAVCAMLVIAAACPVLAQGPDAGAPVEGPTTIFDAHGSDRYWISGQANFIYQAHPEFPSPYSGPHSLRAEPEHALSRLLTLFTGVKVAGETEILLHVESAGGRGISDALGVAGFTNLDVVRNPDLGAAPYLARLMLRQTVAFGAERADAEPNPLSLSRSAPVRALEFRVGKFGTADFFDVNAVGSDSRLQFTNWTIDNNGAYDYAADTRGYTWGAIVEYHERAWAFRYGLMLMPRVANGIDLDWNIARAHADNFEGEWRFTVHRRPTTLRALSYINHANMGSYSEAIRRFESGEDQAPTIENTREQGRVKFGFGVNGEQLVTTRLRAFFRSGWNEPHHESFAYTEVHTTLAFGADYVGTRWQRPHDKIGGAFVTNGLSSEHADYLALGGKGFLLGDGALSYGRENIAEFYYTAHLWRGVFGSAAFQEIARPGYNRDRGPVSVFGWRLHLDF
jgi:hypothetical protein